MKRTHSIGLITGVILLAVLVGSGYNQNLKEMESRSDSQKQETVITQGSATKEEGYYLAELNGYIVVYREDKKTIYEYTNIVVDDLPDTLKKEIMDWKKIDTIQELYGFLENYSS